MIKVTECTLVRRLSCGHTKEDPILPGQCFNGPGEELVCKTCKVPEGWEIVTEGLLQRGDKC